MVCNDWTLLTLKLIKSEHELKHLESLSTQLRVRPIEYIYTIGCVSQLRAIALLRLNDPQRESISSFKPEEIIGNISEVRVETTTTFDTFFTVRFSILRFQILQHSLLSFFPEVLQNLVSEFFPYRPFPEPPSSVLATVFFYFFLRGSTIVQGPNNLKTALGVCNVRVHYRA